MFPAWRPPTPPQWVHFGPRNPNALDRACVHACMRGSVQQRPAGKEEAHAFARLPRRYKLCALAACTPARARGRGRSETVGVDVRGAVARQGTRASSQSKCQGSNGAFGTDPPEFLFRSHSRPPLPRHGVRAREPGSDDGEEGRRCRKTGISWRACYPRRPLAAALRAHSSRQEGAGQVAGGGNRAGAAGGARERPGGVRKGGGPHPGRATGASWRRGRAGWGGDNLNLARVSFYYVPGQEYILAPGQRRFAGRPSWSRWGCRVECRVECHCACAQRLLLPRGARLL